MGRQQASKKEYAYVSSGLTPLLVPVPPMLEQAMGYAGDALFVSFYWTPGGDEAYYDDGQMAGTGIWQGYLAYIHHPVVHPLLEGYHLGDSDTEAWHSLILDRKARTLYVAQRRHSQQFLAQQWPKQEPVHLIEEEWKALQTRIIAQMKRQRPMDMETIGSKRDKWSGFRVTSEQSARRVSSTAIDNLKTAMEATYGARQL